MNTDFITNKILGDLAESICHSHFTALGYDVEYTGIEKFAQRFSKHLNKSSKISDSSSELYDSIRSYPDLLISKINITGTTAKNAQTSGIDFSGFIKNICSFIYFLE